MVFSEKGNGRLAVFDVEGIVLPKRRYLLYQATRNLDLLKILSILFIGLLYEISFVNLEQALKKIYLRFEGLSTDEFHRTLKTIPIIPGVFQVFQRLREKGYDIALISSGLPDFIVEELAKRLEADHARGLRLEVVNNKITGKISGDVIKTNGKGLVLEKILKDGHYSRNKCILIADDRNNLPMFPYCIRTIGYNPDMILAVKCDFAVKGNLQDILPFLEMSVKTAKVTYTRNDVFREGIHVGSFIIPLLCNFFSVNRYTLIAIILITTIVYAFSELARRTDVNFPLFTRITEMAAIGEEKWEFAISPMLFAFSIIFSLFLNPPQYGFTVITILTLGDGTAKFIGKKIGNRVLPYNKTKKLEGTVLAILVSAVASSLFVSPLKALASSTIAMIAESLPLPIDDNIVIPIIAGLALIALP